MEQEIKTAIIMAVSLILIGSVLAFATLMKNVSDQMADIRTTEIESDTIVKQRARFEEYDSKLLNGFEVTGCIRSNYGTGIPVVVDYRINGTNAASEVGKAVTVKDGIELRVFDVGYNNPKSDDLYFPVDYSGPAIGAAEDAPGGVMNDWFPGDKQYAAFLLYNAEDFEIKIYKLGNKYGTGSSTDDNETKFNRLTEAYEELKVEAGITSMQSEVTGILIIDLQKWAQT